MGLIGPGNQLPSRDAFESKLYKDSCASGVPEPPTAFSGEPSAPFPSELSSLFPEPKALLYRVIQTATSCESTKVSGAYFTWAEDDNMKRNERKWGLQ